MTLQDYVSQRSGNFPRNGVRGQESDWLPLGTFQASTGGLCAVDPMCLNAENGITINSPPGTYIVEGKAMNFDGHIRVSRVRAYLEGTSPRLGRELGEVPTDSATMAICDIRDIEESVKEGLSEELGEKLMELSPDGGEIALLMVGETTLQFAVCESGLGDGCYPVFSLIDRARVVGLEVEFLPFDYKMGQAR
jgi:hypothetical protein